MSRRQNSIPARYFDDLYAGERDPWEFETSAYEQAKYDATLAALPRPRYRRGLEIGCSIGVLTARLAGRCASLVAVDVSEKALDAARMRCRTLPNVAFENISVPAEWPAGTFDLIMLSEVVYHLDAGDVSRLADRVRASVEPAGMWFCALDRNHRLPAQRRRRGGTVHDGARAICSSDPAAAHASLSAGCAGVALTPGHRNTPRRARAAAVCSGIGTAARACAQAADSPPRPAPRARRTRPLPRTNATRAATPTESARTAAAICSAAAMCRRHAIGAADAARRNAGARSQAAPVSRPPVSRGPRIASGSCRRRRRRRGLEAGRRDDSDIGVCRIGMS